MKAAYIDKVGPPDNIRFGQLPLPVVGPADATAGNTEGLAWATALGAERAVNYKTDDVDRAASEFAPDGVNVY